MNRLHFFLFYFFLFVFSANAQELKINPKILKLDCSKPRGSQEITHVMLHFCSDALHNPDKPYSVQRIADIFEEYKVSAHYLIDREGNVHQFVVENRIAFHAGKGKLPFEPNYENSMNSRSVGIEMLAIGTEQEMKMFMSPTHYRKIDKKFVGFTEAQYKALNLLLKDIQKRNPSVLYDRKHIVGHDEYNTTQRSDPGSLFDWKKIGLTRER